MYRPFNFLILLLLPPCLYGQIPAFKTIPPEYELEHIKLNFKSDPGTIVRTEEDNSGNLWIASSKGLHVYDGQNVTTYAAGNKTYSLNKAASGNLFNYLSTDQKGNLWLTDNFKGLIQFNTEKRSIADSVATAPPPGEIYFLSAAHEKSGLYFTSINFKKAVISLYHKTDGNGAEKIAETGFTNIKTDNYYFIVGDNHWIIDGNQAIRLSLDGKKISTYAFPHKANGYFLHAFYTDSSIYIADIQQQAIYTWNKTTDKLELFLKLPYIDAGKFDGFFIDHNKVYLGDNFNLYIIDIAAKTFQNISPQFSELLKKEVPNGLSKIFIHFLRQRNGSLLLVTTGNIFRIKKKLPPAEQFWPQSEKKANPSNPVSYRALAEDNKKNIYASYYTGISKKVAGKKTFNTLPVTRYLNSSDPGTYSLTYRNGFLLWNNVKIELATGKHRYLFDSIYSGHCTQFLQNDTVWLYKWSSRLLHCYDLKRDKLLSYPIGLPITDAAGATYIADINDIVADVSGNNLWIGSHFFGLCLITKQGKLIKQYKQAELGTTDDYITDLELKDGELWFGCTDGLGMLHITTGKTQIFKNPAIHNGQLANLSIFSIQPDSIGNFYLGSSRGILYFDTKTKAFFNLAEGHPLSTPEFNRASVLRTTDNRYYFGSTDRLYSFTPGELEFIKSSSAIKPVKLIGISVFNSKDNDYYYLSQNLDSLGKLTLNPFDNNIEFSFSVTDFSRDVYYSYRIKEQGGNWTDYKPDNKIPLYGLTPGNYTLEVKASTSLTDENAGFYTLPVVMKQVWYKKGWVIGLFVAAAAALLFGFLRYRFNQKIKRQKDLAALRTKISSDLHDDVGTLLSGLAMQSQMLTYSANEEQKQPLKEISEMSREAMEHMRDTVWAMDSRKDKYENLIDRMRDFAEKNLPLKKMTHEFIIDNVEGQKFINPEKRQAVYLIFKEAITNIIKHSDGNHVTIHFTEERNKTALTIKDNGSKKEKSNSDGLGLSNMKMRAEKLGGTFHAGYDDGFAATLVL